MIENPPSEQISKRRVFFIGILSLLILIIGSILLCYISEFKPIGGIKKPDPPRQFRQPGLYFKKGLTGSREMLHSLDNQNDQRIRGAVISLFGFSDPDNAIKRPNMATKLVKEEDRRHIEAFEYYYSLGPKRAQSLVADRFDVSESTVKLWSQSFRWGDRIKARDLENKQQYSLEDTVKAIKNKKLALECVNKALQKLSDRIDNDEIYYQIYDIDKLLKLQQSLVGDIGPAKQESPAAGEEFRDKSREELEKLLEMEIEQVQRLGNKESAELVS